MEILWKEIKEYPNYKISNFGDIFSKKLNRNLRLEPRKEDGYVRVMLYNEFGSKRFYLHTLVAETFVPNPNNLPEVDHIDCKRENNQSDNLKWATREENMDRCFGLMHHRCNPVKIKAINIITKDEIVFNSTHEASRELNLSNGHISDILHNRKKSTHNWTFEYIN